MSAKTPTERKREERARKKMAEEERLARLLARRITMDIYKGTDYALTSAMARVGIDEPQDLITRLIHGADRLSDAELAALVSLPSASRPSFTHEEQQLLPL